MRMKLDAESLAQVDFEEMSRREIISLCESLVQELEKTRVELSESVRTEVDLRFTLRAFKSLNNDNKRSNEYVPRRSETKE
jgi:hypothetical protein